MVDEEASTPTRPVLKLNPDTVAVPPPTDPEGRARSAQLLNSANFIARLRREARFQQIVASGSYKGPLIAAEGDSWFQFPFILKDVIDWTFERFAVYCRSEAGDTLDNMVRRGRVPRRARADRRPGPAALGRRQRPRRRRQHRRAPAAPSTRG